MLDGTRRGLEEPIAPGQERDAQSRERVLRKRDEHIEPSFTLAVHLTRTFGIASLIAALGVWLTLGTSAWLWLAMPVFWLVANVFEWATHRYPMHQPLQPRVLYKKHAIIHHRAFTGQHQEIRQVQDLSLVMMPWYTLIIIFSGASPIAVAAGLIGGPGLAGVFLVSAVGYFLLYELIHTLHHLPQAMLDRTRWGRSRALASLRAHHHHHHQLEHMTKANFNVTFPFADKLLGTYVRS
ncbi:MAG: hypothetical protein AAF799_41670 [Myxococcota bacterium]